MKSTHWLKLLTAVLAMLAIALFAACGGGDDDDSNDSSNNQSGDSTASDKDESATKDNSSSGSGANPSGTDERYVATICKATLDFRTALNKVNPADLTDESKTFEILEKPFQDYVNALKDADPPTDLEDYHDDAVDQMKQILQAIKGRDQDALESIQATELPDPPASIGERLDKAARDNKDCQDAGVTFTN